MVSGIAPPLVADAWKYIFHYLDFRGQACCTRVCKLWNRILHELQYEYGRVKALGPLNSITSINLPLTHPTKIFWSSLGYTGTLVLVIPNVTNLELTSLWIWDICSQKSLEVCQDPGVSIINLHAAQWISKNKFITIVDSRKNVFFNFAVWKVSQKGEDYQITQIAQKLFEKKGLSNGSVLSLENRVVIDCFTEEELASRSHIGRIKRIIAVQGSDIKLKQIADSSNYYSSHHDKIFAWDFSGFSAYRLTSEGAKLVWKKKGIEFLYKTYQTKGNDRWFITPSPGLITNSTRWVRFHVFDIIVGEEIFFFDEYYSRGLRYMAPPFWLDGNFIITLVGPQLRIFHIPTRSHLTSIYISDTLLTTETLAMLCPIHVVQIDQGALRIMYETGMEIGIHEIKLENQQGKLLLCPQILPGPTKWDKFKNLLSFIASFLLRFLFWSSHR